MRQTAAMGVIEILKFGQLAAVQVTGADVVAPQTLLVLAVTVRVTVSPGNSPVTVYVSPASTPVWPVLTFTVYEVAPVTAAQLKTTDEVVEIPQLTIGVAMGATTLTLCVARVELQPFSVTVRVIVLVPPVAQLMVCGPTLVPPGLAVPPPKFQL